MPEQRSVELIASEPLEFLVACLCAQWCETCRNYRAGFEALSAQYPDTDFLWVDIEDDAGWAGDFDVENFPTIVIQRGESVLYSGVVLPQHSHLQRQFDMFRAQAAEESRAYASATEERRGWQDEFNVRAALRGR
jgi:thioredoxin 1